VPQLDERQGRLAEDMEQRGDWPAGSPWIRQAVDALPRHQFAPDRLWRWDGHAYVPVDHDADESAWGEQVYGSPDEAAVTQVTDGLPSSSLSCQAVVVGMLDALDPRPGHRVLELGTGTGWNAALLAFRSGPGLVTSVEFDAELASHASRRLAKHGAAVDVHVGDGAAGWPSAAPFDRVISTYAVDSVPWPWIAQSRPGGRIVTPWGRLGHVALTVADDGRSASGRFAGLAQFMAARGTSVRGLGYREVRGTTLTQDERPFTRDLRTLRDDVRLLFTLRVAAPDLRFNTAEDDDGVNAWLHDGAASWAALSAVGDGRTIAYQGGPRRLADELDELWDWWMRAGKPGHRDFGMTVEPNGQHVWCRHARNGPRWPVPPSTALPGA
jgi:protein-L-isoaspartate O-methyltransferase